MKIIIFGAGGQGKRVYTDLVNENTILCFCDNNRQKRGEKVYGLPVISPDEISDYEYDIVAIASSYADDMKSQILSLGVSETKIVIYEPDSIRIRVNWLRDFARMINGQNLHGDVAEVGVFRGDFAKHINKNFPHKVLHLFDTFEGFQEMDVSAEPAKSLSATGYYSNTTVDVVMEKMSFPENVRIYQGYFPKSAKNVNCEFCFVNIDVDLYQPTLSSLDFFWSSMVAGGVLLIHDYFSSVYPNIKLAVHEFIKNSNDFIHTLPIGDGMSIALIK